MSHSRREVSSFGAISPSVPDSLDHCVNADGEADQNLADLNASCQPLDHTALKTKLTELQNAC